MTLHCLGTGHRSISLVCVGRPSSTPGTARASRVRRRRRSWPEFDAAAKGKVLVLGVDSEAYPNPALDFAHKYDLHFAMLTDQHSDFTVGNFPSTYFLDAAGNLVGKPLSPIASLQQLEDEVRTRLGVTVS